MDKVDNLVSDRSLIIDLINMLSTQLEASASLIKIIEKCCCCRCCSKVSSLSAVYYTAENGNVIIHQTNKNQMGQTITVPAAQNTVPGQLIGLGVDGVTQEPLDSLDPTSIQFTTSDATVATVAPVSGGPVGQFAVTRNGSGSGQVVINYSAKRSADGVVVNGPVDGDTFIFQGQPQNLIASLSAQYGAPQAKK